MQERDMQALNHVLSTELGRWFDGVKQYHLAQLEYIGQQEYFNNLVDKEKQNG